MIAALASLGMVISLAACASSDDVSGDGDKSAAGGSGSVTVGSADFPESKLIAEIYALALEGAGVEVKREMGIGSREVYIKGVEDGSVDVVPEYSGALLTYYDQSNTIAESDEVFEALQKVLPDGLSVLDKSDAEDKDGLAVTKETGEKGVKSIADLKDKNFVLGGQAEFETRANGIPGLEKVYGVTFQQFKTITTGPLTEQALNSGDIQVAVVFTTQTEIVMNDWVVLEDPENLFIAQNVLPLVRDDALDDKQKEALNKVSDKLTTADLKQMMKAISVDKDDVTAVAKKFVEDKDLAG